MKEKVFTKEELDKLRQEVILKEIERAMPYLQIPIIGYTLYKMKEILLKK